MNICLHSAHVTDYPNCRKAKAFNTITDLPFFFFGSFSCLCRSIKENLSVDRAVNFGGVGYLTYYMFWFLRSTCLKLILDSREVK